MEVSFAELPPQAAIPFFHMHSDNEEFYANGNLIPLEEGCVLRVAPEVKRSWKNTSSLPMRYIVVQARVGSLNHFGISYGSRV